MGCHTWFYRKIEITIDEVRNNVINTLNRNIDFYDKMINGELGDKFMDAYPEWTPELGIKCKAIVERQLRMVKGGYCNVAIYNKYDHGNFKTSHYVLGKGLYVGFNDLPHDIFRIGKYPDDKLFSFEETLKFLEDKDDRISYHGEGTDRNQHKEKAIERLKKFWDENPNGMIDFG